SRAMFAASRSRVLAGRCRTSLANVDRRQSLLGERGQSDERERANEDSAEEGGARHDDLLLRRGAPPERI
ncbi:MAG: hypothetical protein WBS22_18775, partial [Methylocystis sp.]